MFTTEGLQQHACAATLGLPNLNYAHAGTEIIYRIEIEVRTTTVKGALPLYFQIGSGFVLYKHFWTLPLYF